MTKIRIFFFLLFLSSCNIYSHPIADIGEIDYVYLQSPTSLLFLKKQGDKYIEYYPRYDAKVKRWAVDSVDTWFDFPQFGYELLSVKDDIKKLDSDEFEKIFGSKEYNIQISDNRDVDLFALTEARFAYRVNIHLPDSIKPDSMVVRSVPDVLLDCHYIQFGDKKVIVYTDTYNRTVGYAIPTKDELYLSFRSNKIEKILYSDAKIVDESKKEIVKEHFSNFFSRLSVQPIDGKYALINRDREFVLPYLYDNIVLAQNDIVVNLGNKYMLYNMYLEPVDIGIIQVAYLRNNINHRFVEAIVKNKHKWIENGRFISNPSSHTLNQTYINGKYINTEYLFKRLTGERNSLVVKHQRKFHYSNKAEMYVLKESGSSISEVDEIVFSNKKNQIGRLFNENFNIQEKNDTSLFAKEVFYYEFEDYRKIKLENIFVKKKNKWGIASLYIDVNQGIFTLNELLPAQYSRIEELALPGETLKERGELLTRLWNQQPVLIYDNDRVGLFPINHSAKYEYISKDLIGSYFYRYTLPSGKQGWLDIYANKEIEDIDL